VLPPLRYHRLLLLLYPLSLTVVDWRSQPPLRLVMTGRPMYKSFDPFTCHPAGGRNQHFRIVRSRKTREPLPRQSVGPASSHLQDSMVLQSTANTPQIPVSTLLIISFSHSLVRLSGLRTDILVTDGAEEAYEDGEPLSIQPMGVLREQNALSGDVEGSSAFPSAADQVPPSHLLSGPAAVAPSIEVTLPMEQHESVRTSLESPSAPCTRTKMKLR
jgi:hypothetical protein